MPQELLSVDNLSSGYGDLQILWGVNLHLHDGEFVAVIGSNGVGKTTLLKTIAGLLRPMAGRIVWKGQHITGLDAPARSRLGIVLVPEGKRLFAGMTVKENLTMGAFARPGRSQVEKDLERVLSIFAPLRDKLDRVAGTLSGGEQQMCAIGRGLMARPQLLLVDELSFGLSPVLADSLLDAIVGINRDGMSIILVEQDVLAALKYAHRGYVVSGGRIVKEGTGAEMIVDPGIKKDYLAI